MQFHTEIPERLSRPVSGIRAGSGRDGGGE